MASIEVNKQEFDKVIETYPNKLDIDHSFLHDPPAIMYWDFSQPDNLQFIGKKYMDEDIKRNPTKMRYFINLGWQ